MNTPRRTIRIDDQLWNAATEKATQEGTTVTEVIRTALDNWVKAGAALVVAVLAILTLCACGADAPASRPVAERTAPVAVAIPETPEATVSEACASLASHDGQALTIAFRAWGMISDPAEKIAVGTEILSSIPADSEACAEEDRLDFQTYRDTINVTLATLQAS